MCGLCGVVYFDGRQAQIDEVRGMIDWIVHRGPDQGHVVAEGVCALGNRRLAILDLSPAGALPMQTQDGALTIAYNGEIYNHPELRRELELAGERYVSGSDTETLLLLYRRHGKSMLDRLRGMFAFAIWDRDAQTVLLARDPAGEKPLFYYRDAEKIIFASEIKALLAHPAVPRISAMDSQRLAHYLAYGYIPSPMTAFRGIEILPPAHYLELNLNAVYQAQPIRYWSAPASAPSQAVSAADERRTAEQLLSLLDAGVQSCLLSDVPLGAFLSGGLDSSLIVALMKKHTPHVRTFSIGFDGDDSFDETPYAQQVSSVLGTQHTTFRVTPQTMDLLPKLVWHHDQPFGDSSAIPTYLVSKLTREHVTVALTGDGGDELFAGYERFYAASLVERMHSVPRPVWHAMDRALAGIPEGTGYYNLIKRGRRFIHGAGNTTALAYFDWIRLFDADLTHAMMPALASDVAGDHFAASVSGRGVPGLLDANFNTYLPNDLLVKTDRSTMAASLEGRAPFLHRDLIEFAARLPLNLKLRGRTTKYILKRAARGLLPDAIINRPKHGFGVPLGAWLRRDLSQVREMLLSERARSRGLYDMRVVERLIDSHAQRKRDHGQRLWTLLTLEAWYRLFIDPTHLEHYV